MLSATVGLDELIGERVRLAREQRNMRQSDLAMRLGLRSAQIISNIESGARKIRPEELVRLLEIFAKPLDFFIDPYLIVEDDCFLFRSNCKPEDQENFSEFGKDLVSMIAYVRDAVGEAKEVIKPMMRLNPNTKSYEWWSEAGSETSKILELGERPFTALEYGLEVKLGIYVIYMDAINDLSGVAHRGPEFDAIFVNKNEPPYRRNLSTAHEFFHLLTWESTINKSTNRRIEKSADNFAAGLLMPTSKIKEFYTNSNGSLDETLLTASSHFGVSVPAVYYRLLNLKIIKKDDDLLNGIRTVELTGSTGDKFILNERLIKLVHTAVMKGKISMAKVTKSLRTDPETLVDIFQHYQLDNPFEA